MFSPVAGAALLLVFATLSLLVSIFVDYRVVEVAALAATGTFGAIAVGWLVFDMIFRRRSDRKAQLLAEMVEGEAAFCFVADGEGVILAANATARERFNPTDGDGLAEVLRGVFASSEGVLYRLYQKALKSGSAVEDITSHADGFRVFVRCLTPNLVLWRLEPEVLRSGAVQRADSPVMSLGRNGAILFMNSAARELLGQRPKRLEDVFLDLPLRSGGVHLLKSSTGTQKVLVQSSNIGGGRVEVSLATLPDEDHADTNESADLTSNFDTLPVPLLKVAPSGAILRANAEARRMLNLGAQAPGNLTEHMEGLGRAIKDWLLEAAEGRDLHRSEFLRLTRDDCEVFVQVTLNRVIENGAPALIAVLNDATELKTLEAQFVQSQKMQAIGQLAGGVAHDFNNLLTAISGHCDLLLLRHDQGDPDYGDLVQINQNANRAAALVGQLLAFSRKQTMQPEVMDLRDTLSDLAHLLNRLVGEKVRLTLKHDPLLPTVRGDRRQLEQVMMNLVVNARDAMPDGGEIIVETERRVLREPLHRDRAVVAPGTYVSVRITDEGVGIPKDKLQKVFEPFFTTKRTGEGTGLGLSTVYGIVKQTGGFIFLDSVVGQGTCFTLLFPAHETPQEKTVSEEPEKTTRKLPQKGSGVVLLVEDEAPVRAFAARALRLRGYTVIEAETAEDALSTLDDEDLTVDIFVTDVVMPGMDGPTWVRKARENRPDTSVVFVSGYAEDVFGEGSEVIPNSVFLPKPFSLSDLTDTVHRQLN
ncbi:ATP-binding protein [Tropicibacter naphthalenivorans]|uniref:histidine kinase n=1 Tax=Tropicibacter naphthalenivorans TaxID=441103 RepID=A0A0P1GG07_9RHOB|nr:ATP-binding protein [Tropicibacter naphthalenivorans]CUH80479.1 Blue-light-activated protein [Tropicibacter naphthalenivorans]SMC87030.1 two-component system, cell cycle sensor histidine kinase and response regulator CckA [Tropicibacter naphthalenivorans]